MSGRVSEATKAKLQKSGRSVSDAINYFVAQQTDPVASLEIELLYAKEDLKEKKLDVIESEQMIEQIEEKLDVAKAKTGLYDDELKLKKAAKDFIELYKEDTFGKFDGVNISEAMNISRKGLSSKARKLGYEFDDLHNEILELYNRKKM